jgi:enediyne polyketide synthase
MFHRDPVLLAFAADGAEQLRRRMASVREQITGMSAGGFIDFARTTTESLPAGAPLRAAVLVDEAGDCESRLTRLEQWLDTGHPGLRATRGLFLGIGASRLQIGFLLPGQGAPLSLTSGIMGCLSPEAAEAYADVELCDQTGALGTERVQLAIVLSSLAALHAVRALGIEADFALGHSLGELTALHWAGALDQCSLIRIVRSRGEAMTAYADPEGAMAEVQADERALSGLLAGSELAVACLNSPSRHVVSGRSSAIEALLQRAADLGIRAARLTVVGAFHSPLMHDAVPIFERSLAETRFTPLQRRVLSTVTGAPLDANADLRALLSRHIEDPVKFAEAGRRAACEADLLIEVGPGRILAHLMSEIADTPVVSTRSEKSTPHHLIEVAGAAYAAGAPIDMRLLHAGVDSHVRG